MNHTVVSNSAKNDTDGLYYCATPNPDISGLGVIISFAFAAVLTTGAAVHAAVLDGMANKEHVVMPKFIADWLSKNRRPESIRNLEFQRELLDRLMIALADQQLLTGFALLVSAFVLAGKDVNNLESFDSKISWAQWDLVVLLSCLSSSSHLACVITLKHYFVKYHTSAWLRIILIILFAVLVAAILGFIRQGLQLFNTKGPEIYNLQGLLLPLLLCHTAIFCHLPVLDIRHATIAGDTV
ncbi:uncharacterized protein K452DRAFT_356486 [Aplosporella prunicola CBS 121167]|uniref:Uncharacterized protein n=1 Tax=Aplosporella prunicola CBS 121167 TaxID=1176127 RepID=A0A6A6BM39_9PEZI|nr:uncharacterized protein K452DRAFT_356486 [Aplosporella prunicola CBS 121167]KAF2145189.1 hypothetical protein K452DRAFT_356486 [Aplosporella prunicola CBS 121167]